jgi:hypothetical protein
MATKPFKNSDSYPSELLEHELIDMLNWKGYFLCCKKCQETIPLNTGTNNSSTVGFLIMLTLSIEILKEQKKEKIC